MRLMLHLLIVSFLFACQNIDNNSKRNENNTNQDSTFKEEESVFPKVNDDFSRYIEKFQETELPITIKGCSVDPSDFYEFDGELFRRYNEDNSYPYLNIPTNGIYIALVTLGIADCYLPVLTTYKLNGEIIDEKTIAIGHCSGDCGFDCEEFMTIKSDYSIYTADTISAYECDSDGKMIPETFEHYIVYREGKLLPDGKIQLSDEIRKSLQND